MPVSGLVVTSRGDARRLAAALDVDGRVVVGVAQGCRLPVAIEVRSLADAEALVEELAAREDVLFVDVVSVDFSDLGPESVGTGGSRRVERGGRRDR